jgi:N-acetylated-alpha-linked acidic dipeptidase
MSRFGDTSFVYHAAAARIASAMLLRLANAEILPYDYVEFARTMQRYLPAIDRAVAGKRWAGPSTSALRAAIDGMEREAAAFSAARDRVLAAGTPPRERSTAVNAALLGVERALIRPQGLRTRPWYRNLVYVADVDNGYANMAFPSVNEAIRANDQDLAVGEMADLARRFEAATRALVDARSALGESR